MNVVWRSLEFGICIDSDSVIHEISINLLAELFGDRSRDQIVLVLYVPADH